MQDETDTAYQQGLRDGKINSLEKAVTELTSDVRQLKVFMYTILGALTIVEFMPDFLRLINA